MLLPAETMQTFLENFDIDAVTGFMPAQPPLLRLPAEWDAWEDILSAGTQGALSLGDAEALSEEDLMKCEAWRARVRNLTILSVAEIYQSERTLRRAHHVLAWILHIFVHTFPPKARITIPPGLSIPLLKISAHLELPPLLTYSDEVLYNWELKDPTKTSRCTDNLCCQTLFTGTNDESEFHLVCARIELRGAEAMSLMYSMKQKMLEGSGSAIAGITADLEKIALLIQELTGHLLSIRQDCDPETYYNQVRPWISGEQPEMGERWIFTGLEAYPELTQPVDLLGPSAGQSSLIQALDMFLRMDDTAQTAFLSRMQKYMPRRHRAFLTYLSTDGRPLRAFVISVENAKLHEAYNTAVQAMKDFRDAHIIIATLYIISPSRRARAAKESAQEASYGALHPKGTGGTEVLKFLKGVRDRTAGSVLL